MSDSQKTKLVDLYILRKKLNNHEELNHPMSFSYCRLGKNFKMLKFQVFLDDLFAAFFCLFVFLFCFGLEAFGYIFLYDLGVFCKVFLLGPVLTVRYCQNHIKLRKYTQHTIYDINLSAENRELPIFFFFQSYVLIYFFLCFL